MSTLKERLKSIKDQRIEIEQTFLNSKIEKFICLDVEKELVENEAFAKKDLKSKKNLAGINSGVFIAFTGVITYGISGLGSPNMTEKIGSAILIASVSMPLVMAGVEMLDSIPVLFKKSQTHNMDLIEEQLFNLRKNVEQAAVNEKTTVTDYFNLTKETIKDKYSEILQNATSLFKPLSTNEISQRINEIKDKQQLDDNFISRPKII